MQEFEALMTTMQTDALPDRSAQVEELLHYVSPHPGQSAARIIKRVLKDFARTTKWGATRTG